MAGSGARLEGDGLDLLHGCRTSDRVDVEFVCATIWDDHKGARGIKDRFVRIGDLLGVAAAGTRLGEGVCKDLGCGAYGSVWGEGVD